MYQKLGLLGAPAAVASGTLPFTGLSIVAILVAAATVLIAGIALYKLVPRSES